MGAGQGEQREREREREREMSALVLSTVDTSVRSSVGRLEMFLVTGMAASHQEW
jgi:hypothetical protein